MSACQCSRSIWGTKAVKSSRRDIKRARKPYRCCECRRTIPPGAPYRYETALIDGGWNEYRTCMVCAAIRDDFFACGWTWGELWQDLRDCLDESGDSWLDPPTHPILPATRKGRL